MNVLSLFGGIENGRVACVRAGIKIDKYFSSEIKETAIKCTKDNWSDEEVIEIGDVMKVSYKNGVLYTEKGEFEVDKIDLLIGGSPCQDFSQANKNITGLKGLKSRLFYEYLRILREVKATYFLLENVKMKKEHEKMITSMMGVSPININSKLLSAQLRNRMYWTNISISGIPEDRNIKLNYILVNGWSDLEKAKCLTESGSRPLRTPLKMMHRYLTTGMTTLIFKSQKHYKECMQHYENNFQGLSAKEIDLKIKNKNIDISIYDGVRYLNQNELEKLQTVPEGYTKCLTRNEAAGVLGDGWTVDVIAHILKNLNREA